MLEVLDGILGCLAVLINNISTAFFTRSTILHGFNMNDWMFEYFKKHLINYCGEETAKKVRLSCVEENLEFKGGNCIVIAENFYNKGGLYEE